MTAARRRFVADVERAAGGRISIAIPFDPDRVWGKKERHHVGGSIDDLPVRGPLTRDGEGYRLVLGPAWVRGCGGSLGARATVELVAEGPQRADLAPDVAAALEASPRAAAFFDSLAQFYRKGYLRWIDATTRRPDVRVQRIAEMIAALEAGRKQR